jgi:hypothetical protein
MASHAIDLVPASLRAELLSDSKFVEELGLYVDATVHFGDKDAVFSRRILFDAIRRVFDNAEEFCLNDANDNLWYLNVIPGERPTFALKKDNVEILNDSFWPLCGDVGERLRIFETEAKESGISLEELEYWRNVISAPVLTNDVVSELLLDLELSPAHIENLLKREFQEHSNKISTLVPSDIRYYERLVGKYDGSRNIDEYCSNELRHYFRNRTGGSIGERDFLMSLHKSISGVLSDQIDGEDSYKKIANRAIETCHPPLLISCLEVGLSNFTESSGDMVKSIFECISSGKALENIRLFCSMAVFVDGELARLQIFKGKPPYYRRLASLAQAALVIKVAVEEGVAFEKIKQWAVEQRGMYFFCQGFIDLIEEPRWLPNYMTEEQCLNELYGRVNNACKGVSGSNVGEFLLKELMASSRLNMQSFLPGPLEGNSTPAVVPDEIFDLFDEDIKGDTSFEAYRLLINTAPFWKIDETYLERIVSLLENAQYKLAVANDKDSVYQVLNGLAQVSCMTRSKKLATSVMILSRLYRDYIDVGSEPENYLAMGVVAGAAFEDKEEWSEFIGTWCTELAYLPIDKEAIERVEVMLERLCILEPNLFYTCSKALDIFRVLSKE